MSKEPNTETKSEMENDFTKVEIEDLSEDLEDDLKDQDQGNPNLSVQIQTMTEIQK